MSRVVIGSSLATLLLCTSAGAAAQTGTPTDPVAQASSGAPLDRFGRVAPLEFQLSGGTEDGTASVGINLTELFTSSHRRGSAVGVSEQSLSFILSTPTTGDGDAAPATLDGLANGTRLTVRFGSFSLFARTTPAPERSRVIVREARRRCEEKIAEDLTRGRIGPDDVESRTADCIRPAGGPGNLVGEYYPEAVREYNGAMIPADAREWGFEASVGRDSFEYVDPNTLQEFDRRRTQWSAKAFYTQFIRRSPTAITFSAGYERAYEAADEAVFCPPNPSNTAPVRCVTAAGGPPELNESLLLSAGVRHRFVNGSGLSGFAIAPLLTYDALDDVVGVDVPVYFVPNSDGGLTGGVRFGYRSDRESEFSVGIFIGAAFNILN